MSIAFPLAAKVRFTQKRLSILSPRDRQGLAGRIGTTQTDSALVRKPTVYFPTDGSNLELRLFCVDPKHLELVENPADTNIALQNTDSENHPDCNLEIMDVEPHAAEGDGHLTQSEMDNLFN
jgi:hypothetical protein